MGMPITLSVVAMEVGKRLGVPIGGVGLPGHFVIRDKESGTFADPFGGGVRYDEAGMHRVVEAADGRRRAVAAGDARPGQPRTTS